MTRLYISGPVTGIEHDNVTAFSRARRILTDAGYEAFMPHDIVAAHDSHETAMLICINNLTEPEARSRKWCLVPHYDGLALLPGWEQSEGARLEKAVAEACGVQVKTVDEWLEEAR